MSNTLIMGAGGHTSAKRTRNSGCRLLMNITALAVSAQSVEAGKLLSDLQPLKGIADLPVKPLTQSLF